MNWLTPDARRQIRQLATSAPEQETCGFVLSTGEVVIVPNNAKDPSTEFLISEWDYMRFDNDIVGVWHSHLELAAFSELDQQVMSADRLPWAVYCLRDDSFHQCDPTCEAPLEGRPFVFGTYDCYSLVSDYLKGFKVELPPWPRGHWGEWNTPSFHPFDDEWSRVGKPVAEGLYRAGDILLLNVGDYPGHTDHIGVFVNNKQFLHHPSQSVSRLQTFGGYWKRRLNWVIRPHELWSS